MKPQTASPLQQAVVPRAWRCRAVFDATPFELYHGSVSPLVRPSSAAGLDFGGDDAADDACAATPPPAKYTRVGDDAFVRVASSTASLSTLADDDAVGAATRAPAPARRTPAAAGTAAGGPYAIARQVASASVSPAVALAALPATPLWGSAAASLPPLPAAAAARVASWAAVTGALHTAPPPPPAAAAAAVGVHRVAARSGADGTVGSVAAGGAMPSPLAAATPRSSTSTSSSSRVALPPGIATVRHPAFCGATAQIVGGDTTSTTTKKTTVAAASTRPMTMSADADGAAAGGCVGPGASSSGSANVPTSNAPILSWLVTQHRRRQQVNVLVTEHGMHVSEAEEIAASMHPHTSAAGGTAAAAIATPVYDGTTSQIARSAGPGGCDSTWRVSAPRATYGDGQWAIGSALDEQPERRCSARARVHSRDHSMQAAASVEAGAATHHALQQGLASAPGAPTGGDSLVSNFQWSQRPGSQQFAADADAARADKYGEAGGGVPAAPVDGLKQAQASTVGGGGGGGGRGSRAPAVARGSPEPTLHPAVANARKMSGASAPVAAATQAAAADGGGKRLRPSSSASSWLSKLTIASASSSPTGPQGRPAPIHPSASVGMSVDALVDSGDESGSPLSVMASSPVAGSRSPAVADARSSTRSRALARTRLVVRPLSAPLAARIARWRRNNDAEAGAEVVRKAVGSGGAAALHSGRFDAVALAAFGSAEDLAGLTAEQAEEVRHERSKLLKRRVRARTKIDAAQRLVHERALQAQVHALRMLREPVAATAVATVLHAAVDGAASAGDASGSDGGALAAARGIASATLQRLVLGLAPDDGSNQPAPQRAAQTALGRLFAAAGELELAQASSLLPPDTASLVAASATPLPGPASPHASPSLRSTSLAAPQSPAIAAASIAALGELIETLRLGDAAVAGAASPTPGRPGRSRRGSAATGAASSSSIIVDAASGFHIHKSTVTSALQRTSAAGYASAGGPASQRASRASARSRMPGFASTTAGLTVDDNAAAAAALQPIVDPTTVSTDFAGRDVPAVLRALLRTHGASKTALPADYAHETLARCMDAHVVDESLLDAMQMHATPVRNDMQSSAIITAAGELLSAAAAARACGSDSSCSSLLAQDLLSVLDLSPEQLTAVAASFTGPATTQSSAVVVAQYRNIEQAISQQVRAAVSSKPTAGAFATADSASGAIDVLRVPQLRGDPGTKLAAVIAQQPVTWAEGPASLAADNNAVCADGVRVPTSSTAWFIGDVTISDRVAIQAGLNVDAMLYDLVGVPAEF